VEALIDAGVERNATAVRVDSMNVSLRRRAAARLVPPGGSVDRGGTAADVLLEQQPCCSRDAEVSGFAVDDGRPPPTTVGGFVA